MTLSLLDKCEPPAVVSQRESGVSPFVFLCDHSGRRIPARLNDLNMSQDDLKRHIAWDIGIEGVGRALSSYFDACLIMQPYSRLVIDCNRRPGSETSILAVSDGTKDSWKPEAFCRRRRRARARNLRSVSPKDLVAPRRAAQCGPAYDSHLIAQLHAGLCRYSAAVARGCALQP